MKLIQGCRRIFRGEKRKRCKDKYGNKSVLKERSSFYSHCDFEGNNYLGRSASLTNVHLGVGTYINESSVLQDVWIGCYSSISSNVCIIEGKHPSNFVSTYPGFYSNQHDNIVSFSKGTFFQEFCEKKIENRYSTKIGNDVLIYSNVRIVEGVNIGDGAIVLSGAYVTKDVGAYQIVGGVPARVIRERFNTETKEKLLEIQWWNKDFSWLHEHSHLFLDVELFMKEID